MNFEMTLSIIKPDAVLENVIGEIYKIFESNGLKIIAAKMVHLNEFCASKFYDVHKNKGFFNDLVAYMSSGPIMVQVLSCEDAVQVHRRIMGATDPLKADVGTIRNIFGKSIESNAVHGSDSLENAQQEIAFFFPKLEIFI